MTGPIAPAPVIVVTATTRVTARFGRPLGCYMTPTVTVFRGFKRADGWALSRKGGWYRVRAWHRPE